MEELRKRLDELKPVVKINDLYEKRRPDIANIVVATHPIGLVR